MNSTNLLREADEEYSTYSDPGETSADKRDDGTMNGSRLMRGTVKESIIFMSCLVVLLRIPSLSLNCVGMIARVME